MLHSYMSTRMLINVQARRLQVTGQASSHWLTARHSFKCCSDVCMWKEKYACYKTCHVHACTCMPLQAVYLLLPIQGKSSI